MVKLNHLEPKSFPGFCLEVVDTGGAGRKQNGAELEPLGGPEDAVGVTTRDSCFPFNIAFVPIVNKCPLDFPCALFRVRLVVWVDYVAENAS